MRNDITDFVRNAISTISEPGKQEKLQNNLMNTYRQMIFPECEILDQAVKNELLNLSGKNIFYLKNELIYLITRISEPSKDLCEFMQLVYDHEENPYMKLDLAYGAVLTGPFSIALEYAKSLVPGSEADRINRSWTVAYFGDVQHNPHEYQDVEKRSWTKSRTARLKRFQSSKRKAIRFRILDVPLMYCFYTSRDWCDVNEEDFKIIQQTPIDLNEYTPEEKDFLKEQKEKLVREYEQQLRIKHNNLN